MLVYLGSMPCIDASWTACAVRLWKSARRCAVERYELSEPLGRRWGTGGRNWSPDCRNETFTGLPLHKRDRM